MTVAFHFNADDERFEGFYGEPIYEEIFGNILKFENIEINSKILVGDLIFNDLQNSRSSSEIINDWVYSSGNMWSNFIIERFKKAINENIFVVVFENLENNQTANIYNSLFDYTPFIGTMQIDNSIPILKTLYKDFLINFGEIYGKQLKLYYSDPEGDDQDNDLQQNFKNLGFDKVTFELFDKNYR